MARTANLSREEALRLLEEEEREKAAAAPLPDRLTAEDATRLLAEDAEAFDKSISGGNLARQFVSGATFGLDDEIYAGGRSLGGANYDEAVAQERARKRAFERANPITSFGAKAAGAIAGSVLPVGWALRGLGLGARAVLPAAAGARAANLGRRAADAVRVVSPLTPATRGASFGSGATLGQAASAGAQIGAKAAAYQTFGDQEGNALERLQNMAMDPVSTGGNIAFGAAVGVPFGFLGRSASRISDDLAAGVGPQASAARRIQQAMQDDGRSVADVFNDLVGDVPGKISTDGRRAIVEGYADAIQGGLTGRQARDVALQRYRQTNPRWADSTLDEHVGNILNRIDEEFGLVGSGSPRRGMPIDDASLLAPRMIAAERISGLNAPLRGDMRNLTERAANLSGSRGMMDQVIEPRSQGTLGRVRRNIGTEVAGREYNAFIRNLEEQSAEAMTQGFARADAAAQRFDLRPVLARQADLARRMGGEENRALTSAVDDVSSWLDRIDGIEDLSPAEFLQSYRDVRRDITNQITKAVRDGDRSKVRVLQRLKNDMDSVARPANPIWSEVNDNAADVFQIREAADLGRTLPLKEGARLQDARDWLQNATRPEREAFQRGLARQLYDKMPSEGTHDVAKLYLAGGDDEMEEGLKGLLNQLLGDEAAARFIERMRRERIAASTQKLNKNSPTGRLEDESRMAGAAQKFLRVLQYSYLPNMLEDLAKMGALQADRRQLAEISRRLSYQSFPDTISLLREIERATPGALDPTFVQQVLQQTSPAGAFASQAPGAVHGGFEAE